MNLAIFDVDGTLTDSNDVDGECFVAAFHSEFGLSVPSDWSGYPHVTDRGLTQELLRRAWSQEPDEAVMARHRKAFVDLLRVRMSRLDEIRGARAFIDHLRARGWIVRLATGAWSESARLKLAAAGFSADLPLACCDDLVTREEIVQQALGDGDHDRVVVFGDGVWDVRTARNLQLPFIGVANGDAAELLRREGAGEIIADFADVSAVFTSMLRARVPH